MERLYAIKDNRAKSFGVPFPAVDDDLAVRATASSLIGMPKHHAMYAFARDFELYFLGEVDDDGNLVPAEDGPKAITFLDDIVENYKIKKE